MKAGANKTLLSMLKIKNEINISGIVTIYYFDFTADYRSHHEYHDFWEFVYVDNGCVEVTADNRTYNIKRGGIIFHKPNESHSVRCDGVTPANIFIMTFVCKSAAMKYFNNLITDVPYHLRGLLAAIVEEAQNAYGKNPGHLTQHAAKPFGAEQMIKNYLEFFLIMLIRTPDSNSNGDTYGEFFHHNSTVHSKTVTDVINYLETHLYEPVTIEELCRLTNYRKSYLCALFKSTTGKTTMQYYTELKIRKAQMLIREQRMNNSQISDLLGFSSPQYFSRVFRRIAGMTPGEYKSAVKYR